MISLLALTTSNSQAQEHFQDCASSTGNNATIIVSAAIDPAIDGSSIEPGDEIALFTPEGICAGATAWTESNGSITAWGENTITSEKDGFADGDSIFFKIWDASEERELTTVTVSYSSAQPFYRTEGTYDDNAIYALSTLSAESLPPPGVPILQRPENEAVEMPLSIVLEWAQAENASSYEAEVSTDESFADIVVDSTAIDTTIIELTDLMIAETYYWRVRSIHGSDSSAYSPIWRFTTVTEETGENTPPGIDHPIPDQELIAGGAPYRRDLSLNPAVFTDVDGDTLAYSAHTSSPGVVEATVDGTWLTIKAVGPGTAVIALTAADNHHEVTTTFSVKVSAPEGEGLTAAADHVETEEDVDVEIDVLINDTFEHGESPALTILDPPASGSATIADKKIVYRPEPDFNGNDAMTYRIEDASGGTASAEILIVITPVDDAPYFSDSDAIVHPQNRENVVIGGATAHDAGSPKATFAVEWRAADDVDGDSIHYVWELSDASDFADVEMRIATGGNRVETTHGTIDDLLAQHSIAAGFSQTFHHRILAISAGESVASDPRSVIFTRGVLTTIHDDTVPHSFALHQNYPNPFNPETTISYALDRPSFVTLSIFDALGKEVSTLVDEEKASGEHRVRFDAEGLTSGVYVYRIAAGRHTAVKRMVLLR